MSNCEFCKDKGLVMCEHKEVVNEGLTFMTCPAECPPNSDDNCMVPCTQCAALGVEVGDE